MSEQAERFFISVSGAVKKYGVKGNETLALNGLEFTAREGEMIAVLGKSGSGKSTLLNVLGGMDTLTAGEYFFDGQEISKYSMAKLHQFRKKNIGFVFQNFALLNRYTVYENLEAPLLARGLRKNREKIMNCLDRLGIADLARKYPPALSGGQQQRCAIGRAIITDCRLLLCDEPTGALDSQTGSEIMVLFEEIHHEGRTIIIATHDEAIAERCDRKIRIKDGKIINDDMAGQEF